MRRASDTADTPPVAILKSRRPIRLRASRPRWSVSLESCATGVREAGSISNLSSWNIDRTSRKGAAPRGGPSQGGNAQGGLQHRKATRDVALHHLMLQCTNTRGKAASGTVRPKVKPVNTTHGIGIGGSLAAPPLPHHRTYGSVYGGSVD